MEIRVSKKVLENSIKEAYKLYNKNTPTAFLRIVWIKAEQNKGMFIQFTDSKIEYSSRIQGAIKESGLVGIECKQLLDLLKSLSNDNMIKISKNDEQGQTTIQQENRVFNLETCDNSWFTEFTPLSDNPVISLPKGKLLEIIEKTENSIGKNDGANTMDYMNINYMNINTVDNKVRFCATNSHQFSMIEIENEQLQKLIKKVTANNSISIHKNHIQKLKKLIKKTDCQFTIDNERIYFVRNESGLFTEQTKHNTILSVPYHDEQWIEYQVFLTYFEDNLSELKININALLESLKVMKNFTNEYNRCCIFYPEKDQLTAKFQGQVEESISAQYEGELEKISFPVSVMINNLKSIRSKQAIFKFTGETGPCMILGTEEDEYTLIVMPVEIEENKEYEPC